MQLNSYVWIKIFKGGKVKGVVNWQLMNYSVRSITIQKTSNSIQQFKIILPNN